MFTKSLPRLNSDLELASGAHFWHIYYQKSIPYIIILFQLTKLHYQNFFPSQDIKRKLKENIVFKSQFMHIITS